ncbi:FtsX-like permease family protein [Vibrio ostreicida]|uniref:FtsX-like permease family protein n=1 Tax=Vibrio ostreicida TaxID=526588 RepID=UPI003B5CE3AB
MMNRRTHIPTVLALFVAHYRQAPLQAAAILIGLVLAVTLFVAVQAINLNAKRSYAQSTEQLGTKAAGFILPSTGQKTLPESIYFSLRQAGQSHISPVIKGHVRDEAGRRWSFHGSDLIAVMTAQLAEAPSSPKRAGSPPSMSLFAPSVPLAKLLAGEAMVLVSQSRYRQMGDLPVLTLEGIETQVVAVPDDWQLGNRMFADIGFAQRLLNQQGKLSYIAVFDLAEDTQWRAVLPSKVRWVENDRALSLGALTNSFHLNLSAMSLLAFLVGLFITYNGVKYSLLKRNRLLVQIRQAGVTSKVVLLSLLLELSVIVTLGVTLGFIIGIQLSHWLHPTVALTLEQLYGANLLPDQWQWQWWAQALALTLAATLLACGQHFKYQLRQPLSSYGGFYHRPGPVKDAQLLLVGVLLSLLALTGLWLSEHFRATLFWLGALVAAIPFYLPQTLRTLANWSEQRAGTGLFHYLIAELKELITPLSLAMMALLLAVTANIGMNTLVGSFEITLKKWLEQKLHADIYVNPSSGEMAFIEQALAQLPGVDRVYKQYYVEETLHGLPILLGTKDKASLEQTMVFQSHVEQFWTKFYAGEVVAISEPAAIKGHLSLNSEWVLSGLSNTSMKVGAIFHDYGSPKGEVLIAPLLWQQQGFTSVPSSLGLKISIDAMQIQQKLVEELQLHPSQIFDQGDIKAAALSLFAQTFAVTRALNSVTLLVAVVGLFCSCFMLLDARKAAIAQLYALGVSRWRLLLMAIGQMTVLVLLTLLLALPLGALVGYVLTDMVTLRAFGWSLTYRFNGEEALMLTLTTLLVTVLATGIPLWRTVHSPAVTHLQNEVLS